MVSSHTIISQPELLCGNVSFWTIAFQINTWGYSTINFFAPMSRYASDGGGPVNASREFKEMVKALHGAGIEVYCVFSSSNGNMYNF